MIQSIDETQVDIDFESIDSAIIKMSKNKVLNFEAIVNTHMQFCKDYIYLKFEDTCIKVLSRVNSDRDIV